MKKLIKLTLILFAILIVQSCSNKKVKNGRTRRGLKGKVLSFTEISYEAETRFGNIEKGKRKKRPSHWDSQTKYNKKGNNIEDNMYNSDGSLNAKCIYKYNEKGDTVELNYYKPDGRLFQKTTCKNDEQGNIIEMKIYNSDGSLFRKTTYKNNEQGNTIEENLVMMDKPDKLFTKSFKYEYDIKGNIIEKKTHGRSDRRYTYKNDEQGNRVEEKGYNSDGSLSYKWTFKYEYDKKGNWFKKIKFEDEVPTFILEREYEYYK